MNTVNTNASELTILKDKVFDFMYGCAMHDATLQQSFKGKKTWVGKVSSARDIAKKYVDRVKNGSITSQDEHDLLFLKTADELCRAINKNKPTNVVTDTFSFGNAQKLLNMLIKHAYAHTYSTPTIRDRFRYCFCPMDSIMLTKVWKMYAKAYGRKQRALDLGDNFLIPWGNEGMINNNQPQITEFPDRYRKFQTAVCRIIGQTKEDVFPIEFDYLNWN